VLRSRWVYRARQLGNAVRERKQPIAHDFVRAHLGGAALALFYRMSRRDQAHSVNTAMLVAQAAPDAPDLVAAALLHDAGKGPQQLWQRVLFVVLDEHLPGLLRRWARPGRGTRGALYRSLRHAEIGADLAREAGIAPRACELIAGHHRALEDSQLRLLQWADAIADGSNGSTLE
jgi:hypothetical protein